MRHEFEPGTEMRPGAFVLKYVRTEDHTLFGCGVEKVNGRCGREHWMTDQGCASYCGESCGGEGFIIGAHDADPMHDGFVLETDEGIGLVVLPTTEIISWDSTEERLEEARAAGTLPMNTTEGNHGQEADQEPTPGEPDQPPLEG